MKVVAITAIVIVITCLMVYVRGGEDFHLAQALPFCHGGPADVFDIGGCIMLAITISALARILRTDR